MFTLRFSPFPVLTTDRLILRQLTSLDAAAIFALRSDERVNRYLDRPVCRRLEEAEASPLGTSDQRPNKTQCARERL